MRSLAGTKESGLLPALARSAWLTLWLLVAGCAQLPPRPAMPAEAASPPGMATELDRLLAPPEERHPGESAFRLVSDGPEGFAIRAHVSRLAGRSIDVQTYIWSGDTTGSALAYILLQAADRGVKVRLLLDDMDARAKNDGLAAIDAHPNVEVRMFNPLPSRSGTMALIGDWLGNAKRLNHRMHNKTWIADNRIAIVGGRNLADEYFGADAEVNFVDLDFAMVGPVVRDASASFDRYWNSEVVYPMALLSPEGVNTESLAQLRTRLNAAMEVAGKGKYAEALRREDAIARLVGGDWPMTWTSTYRFIADDPGKATRDPDWKNSHVLAAIVPLLRGAQKDMTIISPYFVPGKDGTASLARSAQAGKGIRILTNSLAANDVAMVYGAYEQYREKLLESGVQLWELKPLPGSKTTYSMFGSSGSSLHTKGLSVDEETLVVGSYNLDARSTKLNCEQVVMVGSPELARQFMGIFDQQASGDRSWKVTLSDGRTTWTDGVKTYDSAPEATAGRKFQAWLAGVLPIEAQL
jgi:putative cardiolipin synthase